MRRRTVGLVLAAAFFVVVGTSAWWMARRAPFVALDDYVAELRARGEPVTLEEMQEPMPDPVDNGAEALDRAVAWLERYEDGLMNAYDARFVSDYAGPWSDAEDDPWYERATDEEMDELRALLDELRPYFVDVAAAAAKPHVAWPLDPVTREGSMLRLSLSWGRLRRMLAARLHAAADHEQRVDTMVWQLALTRHIRRRTGYDMTMTAHHRYLDCATFRDAVESGALDPVAARPRVDELLCGPGLEGVPHTMRVNRVEMIELFPRLVDGSLQREIARSMRSLQDTVRKVEGKPPIQRNATAEAVGDALAGVRFDWREFFVLWRELDRIIPADDVWTAEADAELAALAATRSEEQIDRTPRTLRRAIAAERLARVALAAAEHHSLHGAWPTRCADLSALFPGGVPLDPHTNDHFVLERDGVTLELRATVPDLKETQQRDFGFEWRLTPR